MFSKTLNVARKYGAKAAAASGALVLSGAAMAQEAATTDSIITKVNDALAKGENIAIAVVLGLFTIWAVKLLLKGK